VRNPADRRDVVGLVAETSEADVAAAAARAALAAPAWASVPVAQRAAMLERAADALQARMPMMIGIIVREAGRTAGNAMSEVREAIDFLRYYAAEARATLGVGQTPLGPVACISPWNFPLAIFTGQIAAALVAGNPVLAKPAEETPLIAAQAVAILHEAGVPADVLQLVPGRGAVGAALVGADAVRGVVFTGSGEVARQIQRRLAARVTRDARPIPLVAETGGINAMIVDSSALAEQVVADAILSAFDSAGQRCSSLRLICLQEEIADRTLEMLKGAMAELTVGPPDALRVDLGPLISEPAKAAVEAHIAAMRAAGHAVWQGPLDGGCAEGHFVAPAIIEIEAVGQLDREVFGPVLHVLRYRSDALEPLVAAIAASGFGLTFGLHTRLDGIVERVTARIAVGNVYVNRNMIGATVGVQPFGGRGRSGTGPKAGGPLYLGRLVADPPPMERGLPVTPSLAIYAAWLDSSDHPDAAARARAAARTSACGLVVELAGPVGERNLYACRPKGAVALFARSAAGLYQQLAATFATGNTAVVARAHAQPDWLTGLPAALSRLVAWSDAAGAEPDVVAALVEDAADGVTVARALAAREGAVVSLQLAGPDGYVLDWLVDEVSTSINTAAAGGNASLVAIA
jgi:RHH-type proline utilization regulon transcriptional repressor/proline dehydrogenase/delta 1-pyrroline-5-carboxylate dehydrogenase